MTKQMTREGILAALETGATSLTEIYRHLGGSGHVSGSTTRKMRMLVPDIEQRLGANKASTGSSQRECASQVSAKKRVSQPDYPRVDSNPYRENSHYATLYDVLAAHPDGISRSRLLEMYCKESGKDAVRAGFDLSVVLSPKDSRTGPRHSSAKDGYWVRREGDWVQLCI